MAARAHGMPMMVTAMITAATSQPKAIQAPPSRIQMMFNSSDMVTSKLLGPAYGDLCAASPVEIVPGRLTPGPRASMLGPCDSSTPPTGRSASRSETSATRKACCARRAWPSSRRSAASRPPKVRPMCWWRAIFTTMTPRRRKRCWNPWSACGIFPPSPGTSFPAITTITVAMACGTAPARWACRPTCTSISRQNPHRSARMPCCCRHRSAARAR